MVRGVWAGRIPADPIRNLHQEYIKTMGEEPRQHPAPLNLMGVSHQWERPCRVETVAEISRTECPTLIDANPVEPARPPLQGDDHHLDYDANGYPDLPDCLRRPRTQIHG